MTSLEEVYHQSILGGGGNRFEFSGGSSERSSAAYSLRKTIPKLFQTLLLLYLWFTLGCANEALRLLGIAQNPLITKIKVPLRLNINS